MPFNHAIWVLGESPKPLQATRLADERQLEDAIETDPSILDERWLIVGRQVPTDHGKFIDLLALDPEGSLVVIELKRDRTPRDVIAQALDYASWVETLVPERVAEIYARYARERPELPDSLDEACRLRFSSPPPLDSDLTHQVVVVAADLDPSTERIVNYLAERDLPLNVVFFRVFENEGRSLLSRVWFRDPGETQEAAHRPRSNEPWNGEYYASFGQGPHRDWEDARKYGFISAGGGSWYSRTLRSLEPGHRVWVCIPKTGYVGVGVVEAPVVKVDEFTVEDERGTETPLSDLSVQQPGMFAAQDDSEKAEYLVRVRWLHTVPASEALWETGFFANQNSACAPTTSSWNFTIDRLRRHFSIDK